MSWSWKAEGVNKWINLSGKTFFFLVVVVDDDDDDDGKIISLLRDLVKIWDSCKKVLAERRRMVCSPSILFPILHSVLPEVWVE
jgi:hypothetical protein